MLDRQFSHHQEGDGGFESFRQHTLTLTDIHSGWTEMRGAGGARANSGHPQRALYAALRTSGAA
jgi:hypothetical protein